MSAIKTKTFTVKLQSGQSKYEIYAGNQANMLHIVDISVADWQLSADGASGGGYWSAIDNPTKCFADGTAMAQTDILNSAYINLREGSDVVHEYIPVSEILKRMEAKGERYPVNRNIDLNMSELHIGNKTAFVSDEVVVISVSYLEN